MVTKTSSSFYDLEPLSILRPMCLLIQPNEYQLRRIEEEIKDIMWDIDSTTSTEKAEQMLSEKNYSVVISSFVLDKDVEIRERGVAFSSLVENINNNNYFSDGVGTNKNTVLIAILGVDDVSTKIRVMEADEKIQMVLTPIRFNGQSEKIKQIIRQGLFEN